MANRRMVIKIGTNVLTTAQNKLDLNQLRDLIEQIAQIHRSCNELTIVTSAAITCGAERMGMTPKSIPEKQAAAAVGQRLLMENYAAFFEFHGIQVGQILLTQDGMLQSDRRGPVRDTISALWAHQIIPIINENDSVATEEIKFGDNDQLSAQVAQLVAADLLIILTDIEGLFTAHPSQDPQATLIETVDQVNDEILSLAQDQANTKSRGGMRSKLLASKRASDSGIEVILANGRRPENLPALLQGKGIGTRIRAQKGVR